MFLPIFLTPTQSLTPPPRYCPCPCLPGQHVHNDKDKSPFSHFSFRKWSHKIQANDLTWSLWHMPTAKWVARLRLMKHLTLLAWPHPIYHPFPCRTQTHLAESEVRLPCPKMSCMGLLPLCLRNDQIAMSFHCANL